MFLPELVCIHIDIFNIQYVQYSSGARDNENF